ncbi:glycosyltransferase family 4 protein [Halobacteria archaeon AArc-curdl1]|uniref:Glycosyltransferase family 4 protein n=1 Tax=Natronosalvus hydrolyticus TaxID=2979988 RepID=A0AAP2Z4P1_9EURY|nr:glycosyltransferase family 4 protein [Halobacteria archaeon AArc-curdl1]
MRIGFFHESAGTKHAGGIAIYLQYMAAELSKSHDVYLYTQEGSPTALLRDSAVTIVPMPGISDRIATAITTLSPAGRQDINSLAMVGRGVGNDLIEHIETNTDVLITFIWLDDLLLSNLVDVPTVYGFHRIDIEGFGGRLRDTHSQTRTILANTERTAERITEVFDRTVDGVAYPGIDPDQFNPAVPPAFESDEPAVLFVGRVQEQKGVFDLVNAVGDVDTDCTVHVVGAGRTEALRETAWSAGIGDSVRIHGEIPHDELPGYYTAVDVFCLPSYVESFGMANLEAMACGTPVVSGRLAPIESYLTHGVHGHLVEPGDTEELAAVLERLLTSPEERLRLGANALERSKTYTWDNQATVLEAVCAQAVATDDEMEVENTEGAREVPQSTFR